MRYIASQNPRLDAAKEVKKFRVRGKGLVHINVTLKWSLLTLDKKNVTLKWSLVALNKIKCNPKMVSRIPK